MTNELVSLSDAEREALITWNLDQMAHEHQRDAAMRFWNRASLLIRGRSQHCIEKMERDRFNRLSTQDQALFLRSGGRL